MPIYRGYQPLPGAAHPAYKNATEPFSMSMAQYLDCCARLERLQKLIDDIWRFYAAQTEHEAVLRLEKICQLEKKHE